MKTKTVVAIMVTMLLVGMTFYAIPVKAVNYLKIGVIGPYGAIQGQGMFEGAQLAANWINGPGGGIVIGGTRYDVSIHQADEHAFPLDPPAGVQEYLRLINVEQVDLTLGGFRTECTKPIRDMAAANQKLFYICGAATNELIDCGKPLGTPCAWGCVKHNYATYKSIFRITPVNATSLVKGIVGFVRYYVLPSRLGPLYGVQLDADPELDIKTAVIAENLVWADGLFNAFAYGGYAGPMANIVYTARPPYDETNFVPYLDTMHAREVRLVIHIFSALCTSALMNQAATHPLKAVFGGIDVLGQSTEFWGLTGGGWNGYPNPGDVYATGKCQYETLLAASGTRSPISTASQPYTTVQVWDNYFAAFGHAPIYTMWGVYDGIIALHDTLEAQTAIKPPFDLADANALVPIIEATDRMGVLGKFKYTPYHDPFSREFLSTWTEGYVRAWWTQWQTGRMEVVWPTPSAAVPFAKLWALPDESGKMYPYPSDVDQNAVVNLMDALNIRGAFGSYPAQPNQAAHPTWQFVADVQPNRVIDVMDALSVRADFGKTVSPLPLAYCNEAGHMS